MARGNLLPFGFGSPRSDPFQLLRREMEQLFDNVGGSTAEAPAAGGNIVAPRMDVSEDDQAFKVTAEMPGARPDDVEVIVDDDVLTIRAERMQERDTNRRNYHLVERSVGVFQRSLRLPAPVDASKVQASFDNGVLTVTIPKDSSQARSRRVQVRTGSTGQLADQAQQGTQPAGDGAAGQSSEKPH
ncbi:Hsp20/alpha crystallin family protein [Variovorax ginsengisoli]|uniref:Hsp20/alpha crystallin family protein n=1 Tax=Variovorax ginsengisoli TaxID=363844 RepID=A0ABT8SGE0_9BURK|nr:Hsp20/alpha crystallin family protein [Variovorax ginsengisoli]MDN8618087.1 Hsp20/alpha crystallin family protein [Variovorax ginsengisoli]MDO1537257.1 Hsp20/alpha crystallin family protein [Variovorax ginsengisoli]